MRQRKGNRSDLGVGAFPTRMGWVAAVFSGQGLRGLSLPWRSLDDAVAECLGKAGQSLPEAQRHLLGAIVEGGIFLLPVSEETDKQIEIWLAQLELQLAAFYEGKDVHFVIPLDWSGLSAWQRRVLEEVGRIPWGETRSYGWLAGRVGKPRAARAVGAGVGRNPFPPIVPCHRVIKADGTLGGYGGGVELKRKLLGAEGSSAS